MKQMTGMTCPRQGLVGFWMLLCCLNSGSVLAEATGPRLSLFPTTVLEDIKQTGQVAAGMETNLQSIIERLDRQRELVVASKCEGAEQDSGCAQLAADLGETYLEMLNVMSAHLPEMQEAVDHTRSSLRRRLYTDLGINSTPTQMQDMLLGENATSESVTTTPLVQPRSGMHLSDRFARYYKLVAFSGSSGNHSLALMASDIYLDMEEASTWIRKTRDEITRAQLMEQLNQSFGILTPEMEQVVAGVKDILFGEQTGGAGIPAAPARAEKGGYKSPLEL